MGAGGGAGKTATESIEGQTMGNLTSAKIPKTKWHLVHGCGGAADKSLAHWPKAKSSVITSYTLIPYILYPLSFTMTKEGNSTSRSVW